MEENKIDIFNPGVIMAFVAAFIGDFTFFLIVTHYLCGILVLGMIGPRTKGFLAKLVLGIGFILPGPFLLISIFLAIILSNKILAFIAEQAAIQTIAVFTGGAGEALEGAAAGGAAAEVGATTLEAGAAAAEAGATAAEAAGTTIDMAQNAEGVWEVARTGTEMAEVGTETAEAAAETAGQTTEAGAQSAEATKEAGEGAEKAKEAYEKTKEVTDKLGQGSQKEEKEEEPQTESPEEIGLTEEERPLIGEKSRINDELFGKSGEIPKPPRIIGSKNESEEDDDEKPKQNLVSIDRSKQAQKVQDIKREQQKPKPIQEIPTSENKGLKKVA